MTDAVREAVGRAVWDQMGQGHTTTENYAAAILSAIAALPLADRLAYARGLVEPDGWVVARVPDAMVPLTGYIYDRQRVDGWNDYRAAVLASAKETGDV